MHDSKALVDLDGALEQLDRRQPPLRPLHLQSGAVRFQRLERRGADVGKRPVVLVECRERFTEPHPQSAGDAAQRVQDVFLPRDLLLLLAEHLAAAASAGAHTEKRIARNDEDDRND